MSSCSREPSVLFIGTVRNVHVFLGIRAFANSFADYELTQKTDNYIMIHMDEIVKGPQTISLPYLQIDVFGELILSWHIS